MALLSLTPPVAELRQSRGNDPYHVSIESYGLALMLQCMNPSAPEDEQLWGLHALTFHSALSRPAKPWKGEWPRGLDASTATVREVVALLAEKGDETVLALPAMACFLVPGFDEQTWAVHCVFDGPGKTLKTMSLVRTGEWVGASWLPPFTAKDKLIQGS